jgi:uncharacterized membrane protein
MQEDSKENQEDIENPGLPRRFFLLLATGMILVFAGALAIFAAAIAGGGGSTSGGVVIFIGPIPIVFGVGPDSGVLILAGAILAAVCVALFVIWRRRLVTAGD